MTLDEITKAGAEAVARIKAQQQAEAAKKPRGQTIAEAVEESRDIIELPDGSLVRKGEG